VPVELGKVFDRLDRPVCVPNQCLTEQKRHRHRPVAARAAKKHNVNRAVPSKRFQPGTEYSRDEGFEKAAPPVLNWPSAPAKHQSVQNCRAETNMIHITTFPGRVREKPHVLLYHN
jgi:hypothetical protein